MLLLRSSDDGYALGVVYPREFTELQLATLQSLARLASKQLEMRRQLIEVSGANKPSTRSEADGSK